MNQELLWRLRRLRSMSGAEIAGRVRDAGTKQLWRAPRLRPRVPAASSVTRLSLRVPDPAHLPIAASPEAQQAVVAEARRILAGEVEILGCRSTLLGEQPDWFTDLRTGRKAPAGPYFADVAYRDPAVAGEIKYVWEPSRHHHLTILAAAWWLTGDAAFAARIDTHLRSWWTENPFLSGVHWTSGIEVGIRLISWVWVRRLLGSWPGVSALFEGNSVFVAQLYQHQAYLAALRSHGSSANNHLVAEIAGLFAAASAFPVFPQSAKWRASAASALGREVERQTYPDGLNRELATAYHGLTFEFFLAAACEDDAERPLLSPRVWDGLARMADALASMLDIAGGPPRQGDDDGGFALLLDGPGFDRWRSLLSTSAAIMGRRPWWPELPGPGDLRAALLAGGAGRHPIEDHAPAPIRHFVQGGMVLLRDTEARPDELWCRCDHGPLGFLAIAAHGHADALSVELRHGGTDVFCDPGTYCYHGQDEWRGYFRSTRGHNTLELDGVDQSRSGGLFLWRDHTRSDLEEVSGLEEGEMALWRAVHHGYERLPEPAVHRRQVTLDRQRRTLRIVDTVESRARHRALLSFHLGPEVTCDLKGDAAVLAWHAAGRSWRGTLTLPPAMSWTLHRGETQPILGWYSAGFGLRQPTVCLVGRGEIDAEPLHSFLAIAEAGSD